MDCNVRHVDEIKELLQHSNLTSRKKIHKLKCNVSMSDIND